MIVVVFNIFLGVTIFYDYWNYDKSALAINLDVNILKIKAKKNYIKLGRNPRTTRWTNSFAAEKRKTATTKSAAAAKKGEQ